MEKVLGGSAAAAAGLAPVKLNAVVVRGFNEDKVVSLAALTLSIAGRTYRLAGAPGTLGLISPVSQPFCVKCGRLRLTTDGRLRLCLLRDDKQDRLTPLRNGASYKEIREIFRAAAFRRPFGHALAEKMFPQGRAMIKIGG